MKNDCSEAGIKVEILKQIQKTDVCMRILDKNNDKKNSRQKISHNGVRTFASTTCKMLLS